MKLTSLLPTLLLAGTQLAQAASWTFSDATVSVQGKGGAGFKEKLSLTTPLSKPVILGAQDNLKIILTAKEDSTAKRPHQAFLMLQDQTTGLETAFPFQIKDTGKAKVELAQKDLPLPLFNSPSPLRATILLASFGSATPLSSHLFSLTIDRDPNTPSPKYTHPERYSKKPAIHHIFKSDPQSGPRIISLFFVLAVAAPLVLVFALWAYLGANLGHLGKAMGTAPVSHGVFFGSVVGMEAVYGLYYSHWTLGQVLPVAGVLGVVAFVSGGRALSEVQARRERGER